MKADDVMLGVVEQLIDAIEAGTETWQMPWRTSFSLPYNATTGVPYKGGNVLACWLDGMQRGYTTQQWATYKQWAALDKQVAKGQRGLHLVKWSAIERVNNDGTQRTTMIPNGFVVFNAAQLDDAEVDELDRADLDPTVGEMWSDLELVPASRALGMPSYSPVNDVVFMPAFKSFDTSNDYVATLAHELAHWTGHTDRLARDMSGRFKSDAYAMEELVAELSAAFTCARYNVTPADRSDHASYLADWCRVLRAEPKVLWSVASKAQAATDHLRSYVEEAAKQNDIAEIMMSWPS